MLLGRKIAGLTFLVGLLWSASVDAQQPVIRNRVLTDSLRLGIPARMQVEVSGLPDTPAWLPFTIDTLHDLAVVEELPWTIQAGRYLKEMRFVPLTDGGIDLPGLAFKNSAGGDTVYSNPLHLQVLLDTTLVSSPDIRPVKDIVREGVKWYDYLIYLWILLGVALIAALIYAWKVWRKRHDKPVEVIQAIRSPEEVAYEKLRKLRDAEMWQAGQIKAYQSELTFILREYLQKKFAFPALEQPSSDIVRQLSQITKDHDWIAQVRQILEIADLVKFAKGDPGPSFHEEALERTTKLIKTSLGFLESTEPETEES